MDITVFNFCGFPLKLHTDEEELRSYTYRNIPSYDRNSIFWVDLVEYRQGVQYVGFQASCHYRTAYFESKICKTGEEALDAVRVAMVEFRDSLDFL